MSRPRPIYVVSNFHLHFHYDHLYEYRHSSSSVYFSEYVLLFLDDNVDEQYE